MKEKNSNLKSILIFVISVAILTFFDQLSKIIMVDALKTTKTIPIIKNVLEIQEQPGECLAVEEYFSLCLLLSLWQFWFISHINCQQQKNIC